MKFTCHLIDLQKGLNSVSKAVPLKNTLPILANVLVSTKDGQLKISATNLETAITMTIPASIEKEGAFTVPAKLLREAVSHVTDEKVTVELDEDSLNLNSKKSVTKFNGISAEDFPPLPQIKKGASYLEINPTEFLHAVSLVGFAAAMDETRPMYSGILVNYENEELTFASTDGFRLSEKVHKIKGKVEDFSVVIPAKTLLEVARLFSGSEQPIKFVINTQENRVLFEAEGALVTTGIYSGKYPDYKRVIPTENSVKAELATADLAEAVKLASVFAKDDDAALSITFHPKGHVSVASVAQETGQNVSTIDAMVEIGDEELVASFNPKYLLDALNNFKAEKLIIETTSSTSPCVLTSADEPDFLHIIMPLRIN